MYNLLFDPENLYEDRKISDSLTLTKFLGILIIEEHMHICSKTKILVHLTLLIYLGDDDLYLQNNKIIDSF